MTSRSAGPDRPTPIRGLANVLSGRGVAPGAGPAEEWERKAQRLRDQHLVDRLACRGFTGPEYATFATEFAAYGLAVCRANTSQPAGSRRRSVRRSRFGGPLPAPNLYSQPSLVRFLGVRRNSADRLVDDWSRRMADDPRQVMAAIEVRASGALVGTIMLNLLPGEHHMEVGWHLHPNAEGKGYATEAARAVIDRGFGLGPGCTKTPSLHEVPHDPIDLCQDEFVSPGGL